MPGDPYAAPAPRGASFLGATERDPERLRVGIAAMPATGAAVDPECVAAVEHAARLCERLGHAVEPTTLAVDGDKFTEHFVNVWAGGNAWALARWEDALGRTGTEGDFEPLTWALCSFGRGVDAGTFLRSLEALQCMSRAVAATFESYDAVLTPTLAELPVELGTFDSPPDEPLLGLFRAAGFTPFTPLFNVTGQPAASLPLFQSSGGLPVGVQVATRFGDEETLFALAAQLERADPWEDRHPPVA
jgi:amidase